MTEPKSRSPKKPKVIPQNLEAPHPTLERWREAYDAVKEMRLWVTAPVDTTACDQAAWWKEPDPMNKCFAAPISLMLSSQTKDEVMHTAVTRVRTAVGESLSEDAVIAAEEAIISEVISKIRFGDGKYGACDGYIKQAAQRPVRNNFDSDVPKTVDGLCSLLGVRPKLAFLALWVAWNL
ncbi:hypothetical protein BKA82DRAFT_147814 [Pisolithus tinctorius]|uniref:HhH-GPD domain-containing protein n=1 Tax=Pisolithus tinctorius Marx 270 TaxID=870435 RepID=A0A0C3NP38_PISTI|nr:hypothetical protein BKA82DRAFT_147814 [Pisolithus tinctorius]KIO02655.1 hypothetical protein M404DRAFT_147814 [Pisolithus tinctorius Marx 270]